MSEEKVITAFKGFNNDFTCRGYQYKIGETYKHDGEVNICSSGFHACINPFDVLNYYHITSKFATVTLSGDIKTHDDKDSKIASAQITIDAELKLPEFISDCVNFLYVICTKDKAASGDSNQLAASGNSSKLAASGNFSKLAASGNSSKLATSGYSNQLAASGNSNQLAASGNSSKLAASGDSSKLATSGYSSQLAASGNFSQLAASGNFSKLAASGDSSKLAASGDSSKLAASGDSSIAVISGCNGKVKGGKNCALALTRWVESESRYRITTAYVGEEGIKEDVWYTLDNDGNFIECEG